eukprot:TRINITY_DN2959_c0_g1_i5.p1 TRINITY_DN2959_c0_g1~~TRINITY_DN2959_c0_g1_i5.p1  ORF type:complete len:788 (-),score=172.44 TRINITY_DN2959_c0_g1_i5:284-2647(-)
MPAREYRRVDGEQGVGATTSDSDAGLSDSDWPTTACWKSKGGMLTGLLLAGVVGAFLVLSREKSGPEEMELGGPARADDSVETQYEKARLAFEQRAALMDIEAGEGADAPVRDIADGSSLKLHVRQLATKACPKRKPFPAVPSSPIQYNGIAWPDMCFEDPAESHVFIMGDYGGITCNDRTTMGRHDPNGWICHDHSRTEVYAKTADNTKDHNDRGRYKIWGVDDKAQQLVAKQMRKRAQVTLPNYALNGGDNFYFGGLDNKCGSPMNEIHARTRLQFLHVFEDMYRGVDVPFFSVFGNHDFGGRHFNAAWDQQIAYTWAKNTTGRWILPAFYWSQRVNYPRAGFAIDYFMVDTNKGDAKPHHMDVNHNICGGYNPHGASCAANDGPADKFSCAEWFDKLWRKQASWLDRKLAESTADYKIIVSHFPPDQFQPHFWKDMHYRRGISLFVGSHRHTEEVHKDDRRFAGLNWVVAGGGGGITSEWNPDLSYRGRDQYGFMDMTVSKEKLVVEAINEAGELRHTFEIYPMKYPPMMVDEARNLAKTAGWKESNSRRANETAMHAREASNQAQQEKEAADRELAEKTSAEQEAIKKQDAAKAAAESANTAKHDAEHLAAGKAAALNDAYRHVGQAKSAAQAAAREQSAAEGALANLEGAEEQDAEAIAAAKKTLAEKTAAAKEAKKKEDEANQVAEQAAAEKTAADNDATAKRDASNEAWRQYGDAQNDARRASGEKAGAQRNADRKSGSAKGAADKAAGADAAAARAAAEYWDAKIKADAKAYVLESLKH